VVDDHSTDGTAASVVALAVRDPRLQLIPLASDEHGAQAARNAGIRVAGTPYVAFLDSDDYWEPGLVEACLARVQERGLRAAYTEGWILYEREGMVAPATGVADLEGDAYGTLLRRPPGPIFSSLFVCRDCLTRIGDLDQGLVAFQEWDICLRLAEISSRFAFVRDPLFTWVRHGRDTISGNQVRNATGYAQVVRKHRLAITRHAGTEVLAAHYAKIAELFGAAGQRCTERAYLLRCLVAGLTQPSSLRRIGGYVVRRIAGQHPLALNREIRVYG
jgi:glycosyltransferase involved in cell wall biosynthesis